MKQTGLKGFQYASWNEAMAAFTKAKAEMRRSISKFKYVRFELWGFLQCNSKGRVEQEYHWCKDHTLTELKRIVEHQLHPDCTEIVLEGRYSGYETASDYFNNENEFPMDAFVSITVWKKPE